MADDIGELLRSWGYSEELILTFQDNNIEVKHLNMLTENLLEKLFPKIGDRLNFIEKVQYSTTSTTHVKKRKIYDSDVESYASASSCRSTTYNILEADFNYLYPDSAMKLYAEWPTLSCLVLANASVKEKQAVEDCCTQDGKKVATFRLISTLFPVKNIIMKKKKQWRPSKIESKDALIQYVKSFAEVQISLNKRKTKFLEYGLNLGPALFAVSLDEDTINDYYIVINNITYRIENALKAFDIYFKCFHALNCIYPKESEREMFFLQNAVYGITCETDKTVCDTKTLGLIQEYNKFKPSKVVEATKDTNYKL